MSYFFVGGWVVYHHSQKNGLLYRTTYTNFRFQGEIARTMHVCWVFGLRQILYIIHWNPDEEKRVCMYRPPVERHGKTEGKMLFFRERHVEKREHGARRRTRPWRADSDSMNTDDDIDFSGQARLFLVYVFVEVRSCLLADNAACPIIQHVWTYCFVLLVFNTCSLESWTVCDGLGVRCIILYSVRRPRSNISNRFPSETKACGTTVVVTEHRSFMKLRSLAADASITTNHVENHGRRIPHK